VTLPDLVELVDAVSPAELPALAGVLRAAEVRLEQRLREAAGPSTARLMTMAEAAKELDLPEYTVREMGRRGELQVTKVGERGVRISSVVVENFKRGRI
jgi:excisionase family DNA binding protein